MRGLLAVLSGLKARQGAVAFGWERAVLCMAEAVFDAAYGGYGSGGGEQACLRGCWAVAHASGRGSARYVLACRAQRSGALSACLQRGWARSSCVVKGLAALWHWTGGGGGRRRVSQTCLLGLVLLLSCCRHGGGKLGSAWSPLMALACSQWC